MEKYKKCNIIQFSLILLSSSDANGKLLFTDREINYHNIQEDIDNAKHKTKSLAHFLESTIKQIFFIILVNSFTNKIFHWCLNDETIFN